MHARCLMYVRFLSLSLGRRCTRDTGRPRCTSHITESDCPDWIGDASHTVWCVLRSPRARLSLTSHPIGQSRTVNEDAPAHCYIARLCRRSRDRWLHRCKASQACSGASHIALPAEQYAAQRAAALREKQEELAKPPAGWSLEAPFGTAIRRRTCASRQKFLRNIIAESPMWPYYGLTIAEDSRASTLAAVGADHLRQARNVRGRPRT